MLICRQWVGGWEGVERWAEGAKVVVRARACERGRSPSSPSPSCWNCTPAVPLTISYSFLALKSTFLMGTQPGCRASISWHATAPFAVSSTRPNRVPSVSLTQASSSLRPSEYAPPDAILLFE